MIEMRQRQRKIIQITLSPLNMFFNIDYNITAFFVLQLPYVFLELVATVFITVEEVERSAARA